MATETLSTFSDLQSASQAIDEYTAHPSIKGVKELSSQLPSLRPQLAKFWLSLPLRERAGQRLAYEYGELRNRLQGRGEKRLIAHGVTAMEVFPDLNWEILDGFLNGDYKGDLPRTFMVDPRSDKRLTIHDMDGKTFTEVNLGDPVYYGVDLHTYNHNRDNSQINRARQLMNPTRSLPDLHDPQRVVHDLYFGRFWLRAVESMREKEMLQPI